MRERRVASQRDAGPRYVWAMARPTPRRDARAERALTLTSPGLCACGDPHRAPQKAWAAQVHRHALGSVNVRFIRRSHLFRTAHGAPGYGKYPRGASEGVTLRSTIAKTRKNCPDWSPARGECSCGGPRRPLGRYRPLHDMSDDTSSSPLSTYSLYCIQLPHPRTMHQLSRQTSQRCTSCA